MKLQRFSSFGLHPQISLGGGGGKCILLCPHRWFKMSEKHLQEWPPRPCTHTLRRAWVLLVRKSGTGVMHGGVKLSSHVRLAVSTARTGLPGCSSGLPECCLSVMPGDVTSDMLFCSRPRKRACVELHRGSGAANPHHSGPSRTRTTT